MKVNRSAGEWLNLLYGWLDILEAQRKRLPRGTTEYLDIVREKGVVLFDIDRLTRHPSVKNSKPTTAGVSSWVAQYKVPCGNS
jgi:hypothetical protein